MSEILCLHSHDFSAMGTCCCLHVYAANEVLAATAIAAALAEIERIEEKYSRYRQASFLSAINAAAAAGGCIEVDGETAALLDYAFACHRKSGGLFDITAGVLRRAWNFSAKQLPPAEVIRSLLPYIGCDKLDWRSPRLGFTVAGMEIDFGGLGKEFAADQLAGVLRRAGIRHGLVDLGGDMVVLGPHPDGGPWRVGLRHPRQSGAVADHWLVGQGGLATSGDYERCLVLDGKRFGHILDPRTGWPAEGGLASVTVMADSCMVAGSVATIAMLKGAAGAEWLRSLGLCHHWVDVDGRLGSARPAVRSECLIPEY